MAKKIFRNIFWMSMLVLLLTSTLIVAIVYDTLNSRADRELCNAAQYIAEALRQVEDDEAYLQGLHVGDIRVTLIARDGTVLYDDMADPATMDNHGDRPEVQEALTNKSGESIRKSDTILQRTRYYALLLQDGRVLRLARTERSIFAVMVSLLQLIVVIVFAVLILSLAMARQLSRRIIRPINEIDLEHPLANEDYEELAPLLRKIDHQNQEIARRTAELTRRNADFAAVVDNMSEGLVLLDRNGNILAANHYICTLFRTDAEQVKGRDILALSRQLELKHAADAALKGTQQELSFGYRGHIYLLLANPVRAGKQVSGCVMLLLDVTERQKSEQMRKEFSANVSHELKTPLQSVLGYAEIIKDGLVKEKDVKRFVEKIYTESKRLINLVDDIMKLSRLDEGNVDLKWEQVDLGALCEDVAQRLSPKAAAQEVTLTTACDAVLVRGVPQILDEIVFNLVDNAIKYNREGGSVTVSLQSKKDKAILTVADTGIGISDDDMDRIFERFYRVDKSRSRDAGGTGLGLSIVKHGAALHNATIDIRSEEGKGTEVSVVFPRLKDQGKIAE